MDACAPARPPANPPDRETNLRRDRALAKGPAIKQHDDDVPFTSGKFLVDTILDTVFGRPVPMRMRTGFFPFVEPGFEIDMMCQVCAGLSIESNSNGSVDDSCQPAEWPG
jgi:hypothetical protein